MTMHQLAQECYMVAIRKAELQNFLAPLPLSSDLTFSSFDSFRHV